MKDNVKLREVIFHNSRFGADQDPRSVLDKYYLVGRDSKSYCRSLIKRSVFSKSKVLEYGCGSASEIQFYKSLGSDFYGIDISDEAIKRAKEDSNSHGFKACYAVMDAESTNFPDRYFDVIFGSGILHHLDLKKSLGELSRIVADNGCAIFIEPLGHNPLINLFRNRTRDLRSPDERPLLETDLNTFRDFFNCVEFKYFHFLDLAAVPLRNTIFFNGVLKFLAAVDHFFIRFSKWYAKNCWIVVISLKQPLPHKK